MATFKQMAEEIEKELNRGGLSLIETEVKQAINDAIAYHQYRPFKFNQGLDSATVTVANTETYALPSDLLTPLRLQAVRSATDVRKIKPIDWETYQEYREGCGPASHTGPADYYTLFAEQVFLYPTPTEVFNLRWWYIKKLAQVPLTANSNSNAWTTTARLMIKSRAKYLLCIHKIMNADWATLYATAEKDERLPLQSEFTQFTDRKLQPEEGF